MIVQPSLTLQSGGNTAPRAVSFIGGAWRALTWRHVLYTFLLCLGWSVVGVGSQTSYFLEPIPWGPALNAFLSMQLNGFAVLLAVLVGDQASSPPMRRWRPYALAVLVGVAGASALLWFLSQSVFTIQTAYRADGAREEFDTFFFRHAINSLVVCGLAACVYVRRRWAAQRIAALRHMQVERAKVEKRVLESRLAAIQARVDPRFLLDTLTHVEELYEIDASIADRLLKELTTFLRAAIPRVGDPASTVLKEIRLTNAYLSIVGMRWGDRVILRGNGELTEEWPQMPPMILLPLISHALEHRSKHARDDPFTVDVVLREGGIRLSLHDTGAGFAPESEGDPGIQRIRERLSALYEDSAGLTLTAKGNATEALVEIPQRHLAV